MEYQTYRFIMMVVWDFPVKTVFIPCSCFVFHCSYGSQSWCVNNIITELYLMCVTKLICYNEVWLHGRLLCRKIKGLHHWHFIVYSGGNNAIWLSQTHFQLMPSCAENSQYNGVVFLIMCASERQFLYKIYMLVVVVCFIFITCFSSF